jgi:hypothetical protein
MDLLERFQFFFVFLFLFSPFQKKERKKPAAFRKKQRSYEKGKKTDWLLKKWKLFKNMSLRSFFWVSQKKDRSISLKEKKRIHLLKSEKISFWMKRIHVFCLDKMKNFFRVSKLFEKLTLNKLHSSNWT